MANLTHYQLDVLASCPDEMNRIAERIKQPSARLVDWVAGHFDLPPSQAAAWVAPLLEFKFVEKLFHPDQRVNQARRFQNTFQRYTGVVNSHLLFVSEEFPTAVFLLEYFDMQASYSGKRVIHAGAVVQEVLDGNQQSQALDWALLDIFAPFKAEWSEGLEFGSLWQKWAEDIAAAVEELCKTPKESENGTKKGGDDGTNL
jgi:hypothetical protein